VTEGEHVAEDLVTRSKPGNAGANRLDDAGDIQSDAMVPRCAEPDEEAYEARPRTQAVEIRSVDGCGSDPDQHSVVRGHRTVDVREADDIGRAVPILDRGLH
jgi:hypothetical protein